MNILLVSQYFWPESFIINELAQELVRQGHSVSVFTGKPNYPSGQIYPGYSQHDCMNEVFTPGVPVFRVPLRPRKQKGGFNLFLNYCSFVYHGIKFFPKAIQGKKVDVILAFGWSPITAVIPAIILKWKTKAHLAVWIQDLWPESLKATGYIKNRFILWMLKFLVRWIYCSSDTLLVQSKSFIQQVAQIAPRKHVIYYPNSLAVTTQSVTDLPSDILHILETYRCFIFAGNLGIAQALDTVLDAAKALGHLERFRLIIVGDGSRYEHLAARIKHESLHHVMLLGRYPMDVMPAFFSRAAGLIVSLTKDPIFSYTIPYKTQSYLAAGRPIIAALNGEGAAVVNEAGAGLTCHAENSQGLQHCIETLYAMTDEERDKLGQAGRAYFMEHFEMSTQVTRLIEVLQDRIKATA